MVLSEFGILLNFVIFVKTHDLKLVGKQKLFKLQRKNKGNIKLIKAIDKLILDLENENWETPNQLTSKRPDADCVYGGEFYFFNISVHRTMIMIEFESDGKMSVVWADDHNKYELIFKNNKRVIRNWLKDNDWI
jgi:mRNA interferase HigB